MIIKLIKLLTRLGYLSSWQHHDKANGKIVLYGTNEDINKFQKIFFDLVIKS